MRCEAHVGKHKTAPRKVTLAARTSDPERPCDRLVVLDAVGVCVRLVLLEMPPLIARKATMPLKFGAHYNDNQALQQVSQLERDKIGVKGRGGEAHLYVCFL